MTEPTAERSKALLLRAEVDGGTDAKRVVTNTVDVSEGSLTLACDSLDIGDSVRIRLSFPSLVDAFVVEAVVTSIDAPNGYGRPALTVCEIRRADDRARQTLASLAASARAGRETEPRASATVGRYKCLLVEDNRFIRELFSYGMHRYRTVRGADLTLELANDAEGAWEMLEREQFDMAIIDHFLPVQTGAQLIARIRAEPRLSEIPVVAISVGGPEARQEAMGAGADLFLDKPVVLRELFSTLDKLTSRCGER